MSDNASPERSSREAQAPRENPYYPYGEPPLAYGEPEGLDLKQLFGILRRRRAVILSTVVLITTLAVLVGLLMTPKYTATALVMIDPRKEKIINVEEVLQGLNPDTYVVETQIKLIASRAHAEQVMERLRLFDDPEFNVAAREGSRELQLRFGGIWEKLANYLPEGLLVAVGIAEEPTREELALQPILAREAAIAAFLNNLRVRQEGRSYVIAISFTSVDPAKAARVANTVAQLYVESQRQAKVEATQEASSWLAERLETLRQEVVAKERAVEEFRARFGLVAAKGRTLTEQELADLNRELAQARADLAAKRAKLEQIRAMRGQGLDAVADVIASPVIINLRQQEAMLLKTEAEMRTLYGEKHPKMQQLLNEKESLRRKIQDEVNRIIRNLQNEVNVAAARVRSLERDLDKLTNLTEEQRKKLVRLRQLEREAQASRQLYEAFLQRFKETREQAEVVKSDARVISEAAPPESPSTPGPTLFAAVGFVGSSMLGVLLALLLERLDSGLRSGRQIEAELGLPFFGLVPKLERLKRNQKPHQYLMEKPLSAYAEAIRSIFTSLQLSDVDEPPKLVLVTSSIPQEGKTTLAVSLAVFAARSSQRTLLMDLDLRHPSIQRELGFEPETGFVEYMAGERELEEVIRHHRETGVDYLPIRKQTPNPTDLLGSRKMKQLLAELKEKYDFVVIDSAPLLGVTDSRILARLADKVLFAVRWDKTDAETARNALDTLRDVRADIAGAVLTLVDVKKHAQYGYGDVGQYYGKYQKYYHN